jgi:CHAD domain-containing protein
MRRLRSAFSLFRPAIADKDFERLRDDLRWFARELGEARNLDVFLERDLPAAERDRLGKEREHAYDAAIAAMESPRFRRLMPGLTSWVARGAWRENRKAGEPLATFTGRRIDRLWRRLSRARKLRAMGDRERHRLRIQAKKLRYALEFVEALHAGRRKRRKKFGKAVKAIQGSLGRVHDLSLARMLLLPAARPTVAEEASDERRHLRDAKRSLRQLRKIGPYWRDRRV